MYAHASVAQDIADPARRIQLALDEQGRIAGFCKLGLECRWPEHARGRRVIELKQLYADPVRTGQGIGAALMTWALGQAAALGADEMQLSVWSENTGAQRFYGRYGFTRQADIDFWVGEHRDHEYLFARLF